MSFVHFSKKNKKNMIFFIKKFIFHIISRLIISYSSSFTFIIIEVDIYKFIYLFLMLRMDL